MYLIRDSHSIKDWELDFAAIRSQGAGGQNVNKVATAIHLRFDIKHSSLPPHYKACLLALSDKRINQEGVIVIKAQSHRTQEKNRTDAIERLVALITMATEPKKHRRATRPTLASKRRRLDGKKKRAGLKGLRGKVQL